MKEAASEKLAAGGAPRPQGGSGIEAALAEAAQAADFPPRFPDDQAPRREEGKDKSPKPDRRKRRLEDHVQDQVARQQKRVAPSEKKGQR